MALMAFWMVSSKVLPMAITSPTDFMAEAILELTLWNFLRSQRGILTTI